MDEKITNKNMSQKSMWKQQEVQLLHWMNFTRKTFKTVASMKKRSTWKSCVFIAAFHRYITCLIPVSEWRATSKKKHVKNRVKFKVSYREVQVLHAMHFWRICFAIKAERMILLFLKLLENGWDSEKTINMKTFHIFCSFSTVYRKPHLGNVDGSST